MRGKIADLHRADYIADVYMHLWLLVFDFGVVDQLTALSMNHELQLSHTVLYRAFS